MRHLPLPLLLFLSGCAGRPNVSPVTGFDIDRYDGTWYEIARLDHKFERGLSRVTARYAQRKSGGVTVFNRGWSAKKRKWSEAVGKAYFRGRADVGELKVTFFWPFSGRYIVFALDHENYQWALVSGGSKKYLWILARTPRLPEPLLLELVEKARAAGYDTSKLIYVEHE